MKEFVNKLIVKLEKLRDRYMDNYASYSQSVDYGKTIGLNDAISIVNQLAEEWDGGWIPVEEKYPDSNDYILLSFSNFSIPVVGRWEEDEDGGAFYVGDDTETCVSQDMFVNAWMPLVKPYREEG